MLLVIIRRCGSWSPFKTWINQCSCNHECHPHLQRSFLLPYPPTKMPALSNWWVLHRWSCHRQKPPTDVWFLAMFQQHIEIHTLQGIGLFGSAQPRHESVALPSRARGSQSIPLQRGSCQQYRQRPLLDVRTGLRSLLHQHESGILRPLWWGYCGAAVVCRRRSSTFFSIDCD